MGQRFLGKSIPSSKPLKPVFPRPPHSPIGLFTVAIAVCASAAAYIFYFSAAPAPTPTPASLASQDTHETVSLAEQIFYSRSLAGNTAPTSTKAKATATASPASQTYNKQNPSPNPTACDQGVIGSSFNANSIFPFFPDSIMSKDGSGCSPTKWNLYVFEVLSWKILSLLNWAAGTLAVILTVYAGLLYIAGFANEGNAKKAKGVLIATYSGLIIVVVAKLILYGSIQVFSSGGITTGSVPVNPQDIVNPSPSK